MKCIICGCTDEDCRQCIVALGEPCSWIEPGYCSACFCRLPSSDADILRGVLSQVVLTAWGASVLLGRAEGYALGLLEGHVAGPGR